MPLIHMYVLHECMEAESDISHSPSLSPTPLSLHPTLSFPSSCTSPTPPSHPPFNASLPPLLRPTSLSPFLLFLHVSPSFLFIITPCVFLCTFPHLPAFSVCRGWLTCSSQQWETVHQSCRVSWDTSSRTGCTQNPVSEDCLHRVYSEWIGTLNTHSSVCT